MYKFRVSLAAAGLLAVVFLPNVAAAAEKLYFAVPSLNGKAQLGPSEFNFELGYLLVHRNKQNAFGNCRVVFTTENEKDGH
ncbi:hypothetical protein NUH88_01505 [Nisaea acidiphila]|uniref:Uncharacterized protein n=1 Tax=Nisaea acidiphila TaxID=1862145 RepID=A0A9J7AV86_9PROT|nr:hypothetical protein [Nisaea acidiphila]UUX50377.1 hypothetical protein NUH88_01505 [Nisaea acidiphila]